MEGECRRRQELRRKAILAVYKVFSYCRYKADAFCAALCLSAPTAIACVGHCNKKIVLTANAVQQVPVRTHVVHLPNAPTFRAIICVVNGTG
jgi:hypothetical protein